VGLAGGHRPHPRAVIFDLDRCLIDSRAAWRYCIEESFAAACNRHVSALELADEYHVRPWRDALSVISNAPDEVVRCERLCDAMFERSAMKKLLVHEGVGMALDSLRGERIELGAISRLPHSLAVKQVQSTGLDRFLAVLSATPAGARWDPAERVATCLRFLESPAAKAAFISGDDRDLDIAARAGLAAFAAGWASGAEQHDGAVTAPSEVLDVVMRAWAARGG
jgi:phosphoglycolate phosphatase-like HAD superfamily hydrolase